MYSGDAYRLVDGLTCTAPICPSKGAKQGCPLGPILFALFLSDVGAALGMRLSTGRMGVPLQNVERGQSGVWHVPHLLFADDLAVVDTSQECLQSQMHSLLRYANDSEFWPWVTNPNPLTLTLTLSTLFVPSYRCG
jgi:hypothetical protein